MKGVPMTYLAREGQPLKEHLNEVIRFVEQFAETFAPANWGKAIGTLHDLGKICDGFQKKINPQCEDKHISGANHSGAGAAYAEEHYGKQFGRVLAYLVAGHHTGLPDYDSDKTAGKALSVRMQDAKKELDEIRSRIGDFVKDLPQLQDFPMFVKADNLHLWMRMLFSCLIDADRLDAERAGDPEKSALRLKNRPSLLKLKERFDVELQKKIDSAEKNELNTLRNDILSQCREAGRCETALRTLTVPTGGGKTLSSMAFALEHAVKFGKKRIIYVIPYTSIIEQTADEFRKYFGAENVLEHHSNIDLAQMKKKLDEEIITQMELASENWDAPIIVTTNVQFFESLYSAHPGRCRKIHNVADSIVILDEAQLITPEYLTPCVEVLNELSANFGTTVVLCTATQPAFDELNKKQVGVKLRESHEIISAPNQYYELLKRVKYHFPKDINKTSTWEEIAEEMLRHEKVLCVVNTRTDCRKLYEILSKGQPDGTIHLSALMCGEHRSEVIKEIKRRLEQEQTVRVISTQLIEAGVDIDFPVVYRALAGLDSIVQAAGRCNREGKLNPALGQVHVFVPEKPAPKGLLRKGEDTTRELMNDALDVHRPETFAKYFELFYSSLNDTGKQFLEMLQQPGKEGSIYFRTVGETFRLIDDDYARPVIVRYGESPALIKRLEKEGIHKELMRCLQRYTVNIPQQNVSELLHCGMIHQLVIHGKATDILVQTLDSCYSSEFGVDLQKKEMSACEGVL